jgi:hypothetical protein
MSPQQIDALERLLFYIAGLVAIPLAWLYAEKRGRRPWVWAFVSLLLGFITLLVLKILPDQAKRPAVGATEMPDGL